MASPQLSLFDFGPVGARPDMLQSLEKDMEGFTLILRLDQQATLESRTLNSDTAWRMSQRGMSDWEILSELGVDTELRSTELI